MKQIIIAIAAIVTLASCTKTDERQCWRCTTTTRQPFNGPVTSTDEIKCDMTEPQIRDYERKMSRSYKAYSDGTTSAWTQSVSCN